MSAPLATEAQIRTLVESWQRSASSASVLALYARPQWNGPPVLQIGGTAVRVVTAVSPLAMRAALVEGVDSEADRLVVLTECDGEELGAGLLAHCAGQRVINIDPWQVLQTQVRAASLDPALATHGRRLADALLEYAPPGGWPPVAGGILTRGDALRSLAARLLDVEPTDLDAAGLLQWSTRSRAVVSYTSLPADLRAVLAGWLAETAGSTAHWIMASVNAGAGTDAVAMGIVAGLLWHDGPPSTMVEAARARLEKYLDGRQPAPAEARAWAETAVAWVQRALDSDRGDDRREAARSLARAEELLVELHAERLIVRSDLLPGAFTARVRDFATAVRVVLLRSTPAARTDVEAAARAVAAHRAPVPSVLTAVEMALRLLRWLSGPDPEPTTLAEAVMRQVRVDGWVDRARLRLWVGVSDPVVAETYRQVHTAVDVRRTSHDQQFARLLHTATRDDATPGSLLYVEDILRRVVRPLLDQGHQLLLVVVDGMSVAADTQLVESLTGAGWWELTPEGGPRIGTVAVLPTVTRVSRTSLFTGRLVDGGQPEEQAGLRALLGPDVRLFHDAVLAGPAGASLSPSVVQALRDPGVRLVATVVNAIDNALAAADPAATEWTREAVRHVDALLGEAAGRVVVLMSDHGHVVDRGDDGELRTPPMAGGARWRPAASGVGDGEEAFAGPRVMLGGGQVVLPWRENLRYAPRKAGYHGGASPAEAVIPLNVLVRGVDVDLHGWNYASVTEPPWWREPMTDAPQVLVDSADALFELRPAPARADAQPPAEPVGGSVPVPVARPEVPSLVAALLASEVYKRRQRLRLGHRPTALPEERVVALLSALVRAGGRLRLDALSVQAGVPAQRIANTVTILRGLLGVEGYHPVSIDADGQTVVLDEQLLREQFGLPQT